MTDDRAARQFINDFFSEPGSGPSIPPVPAEPAPRTRQLRATFREPTTGFPGTKAFSTRPLNPRASGATVQSKTIGPDGPPAHSPRADDAQGRRAAVLEAGGDSGAVRAVEPAAEGAGGGGLRGRGGVDQPKRPGRARKDKAPALPAAIAKLVPKSDEPKAQSKLIPTETERADARRLFREIGQRFNENRKKSKTAAYAGFRHDLMDNLDTLVMGGAIDLKEATSIITNLEQYTKETEAESTETPATILGRWLRMDAAEIARLAPVEEVVEDEENLEEVEEDELDEPAEAGTANPVQDIFI